MGLAISFPAARGADRMGLTERLAVTKASGRNQADRADKRGGLSLNIPEHLVLSSTSNCVGFIGKLHGRVFHVHVLELHLG